MVFKNSQTVPKTICGCLLAIAFLPGVVSGDVVFTASGEHIFGNMVVTDDKGLTQGSNLLHSFSRLNINTGESLTFEGPDSINNILARVTGSEPSVIRGLLKSNITQADLFLLNPNGVVFGEGAQLEVDGTFHVSTAHTLEFNDGSQLLVSDSGQSTLTIAEPSAFGFSGSAAPVTFDGVHIFSESISSEDQDRLSAASGFSVTGGNISIGNSRIFLAETPIRLASVKDPISIPVAIDSPITIDSGIKMGTILVSNDDFARVADIETSGESAGRISIFAESLLLNRSNIFSDTTGDVKGNGIKINLSDKLTMIDRSRITADTISGTGQGGDIEITAKNVSIDGLNSIIASNNNTDGGGGTVSINSQVLTLSNEAGVSSISRSSGNAGLIDLSVDRLEIFSGGEIRGQTVASGNGGNIQITASEAVTIGDSASGSSLIPSISVSSQGSGNAGTIALTSPLLTIHKGQISSSSGLGAGSAGSVVFDVEHLLIDKGSVISTKTASSKNAGLIEISADQIDLSGELTTNTIAAGNAGDIVINANELTLQGVINGFTSAAGTGGDIDLNVANLIIDSGIVDLRTEDQGNAGLLTIDARNLTLLNSAELNSSVFEEAQGQGGTIDLNVVESISVNNSTITASTDGMGHAGIIDIESGDIEIFNNGIVSAATSSEGNGGGITITARDLLVHSGGTITTASSGSGEAGSIVINLIQGLQLDGSETKVSSSTSSSVSPGGNIAVTAGNIELHNGASITTEAFAQGFAGNIDLSSLKNLDIFSSKVRTDSEMSGGGNVEISAIDRLYLLSGELTASARGVGTADNGGNVTIDPIYIILNDSSIFAQAVGGDGGIIQLDSQVFLSDRDSIISATSELGNDGEVRISAPDNTVAGALTELQAEPVPDLLDVPCAATAYRERSSLVVLPETENMTAPDDIVTTQFEGCVQ